MVLLVQPGYHSLKQFKEVWYTVRTLLNSSTCQGLDIPSKRALPQHMTEGLKCWWQISHCASTFTLRRCKLSFVGRMFEQALHKRVWTLGGTFNFNTFFQSLPFCRACECSPCAWFLNPRALYRLSSLWNFRHYFPFTLIHYWSSDCSRVLPRSLVKLMEQTKLELFHGSTVWCLHR